MLIALEGIDGAGKRTQAELLVDRIRRNGLTAGVISFPRYIETIYARSIARYLNGEYGPLNSVDPHFAALLYAGDRVESREHLASLERSHDIVVADRYVASNLAYQAARFAPQDRWDFIRWIGEIEHEANRMPHAALTVLLDVSVAAAARLVRHKSAREYTDLSADIHEQDLSYLAECRAVYGMLASSQYGSEWVTVTCASDDDDMLSAASIHELIWRAVAICLNSEKRTSLAR